MISRPPSSYRLAVLSDLHANAGALAAALRIADREGYDCLAILGDLFSYGCHPVQVLSLVHEVIDRREVLLLLGNHDQFYLQPSDLSRLPGWLRESIQWTREQLGSETSASELPWQRQARLGPIVLAHANPFGFGDWTYLAGPEELTRAGQIVAGGGALVGVFGHTHRSTAVRVDPGGGVHSVSPELWHVPVESSDVTLVANPGSVGQPRCATRNSTMLLVTVTDRQVVGRRLLVPYDVGAHTRAIEAASLTASTKQRLVDYFVQEWRVPR